MDYRHILETISINMLSNLFELPRDIIRYFLFENFSRNDILNMSISNRKSYEFIQNELKNNKNNLDYFHAENVKNFYFYSYPGPNSANLNLKISKILTKICPINKFKFEHCPGQEKILLFEIKCKCEKCNKCDEILKIGNEIKYGFRDHNNYRNINDILRFIICLDLNKKIEKMRDMIENHNIN